MHQKFTIRALRVVIVLTLIAAFANTALAQQGSADSTSRAAAQALFDQGRKLMGEKKYAEACEKLETSHKLDPGVGTLLYLGDCYEQAGKLASGWAAFEEAASLGTTRGEMDRVKVAQVRATALKPRIPMLVFVVTERVPGLEVRRDGALVPEGSWGSPLPVDAGDTVVMASAPGYHRWESKISVPANLKEPWTLQIPTLVKAAAVAAAPASQPPESPAKPAEDGSSQRTVGLVVGGVGLAALVVSGTLTIFAAGKNSNSQDSCLPNSPNQCSPAGVADREDALQLANIATVAGIAGGVLVAGGATLYFTAPRSESAMPQGLVVNLKAVF